MQTGRNSVFVIVIILGAALSLAAVSYEYASFSSDQVSQLAAKDLQSSTQRQAHDLSSVLTNKIEAVNSDLRVAAKSQAFQDATSIDSAKGTLSATQDATKGLTDFYMWLDANGHMVWLSNLSDENYQQYKGTDLSYRPYFLVPKETNSLYYSTAIVSNDQIPRMYISYPITDANGHFNGVIAGAIRLDTLGKYLQSQLSSSSQGSVGMLDRNGTILYSDDLTSVGLNVFSNQFQAKLPDDLKPGFNEFLHKSLSGGTGVDELTYRGVTGTYAYNTVSVDGKDFGVLYVTAAHALTSSVNSVIDQQRAVNIALILGIGALATGIAVVMLSWNKRLHTIVHSKTQALEEAVSSLQNVNSRLEDHDKMQKEFVNIAAHELRTPVQPLIGIAETMQLTMQESGKDTIELTKEEVEMLARNSKRLERLTQNILDVTRIETRGIHLSREQIDLNEKVMNVIRDTLGVGGQMAGNTFTAPYFGDTGQFGQTKQITVSFHTSQSPLYIYVDRTRIFEVVSNLLRNALKFTSEGEIEITASKVSEDEVQVRIKDSGRGIDAEIFPRLFEKFSTKSENGTGLGLYLSKAIVEAHGGKIWAENNPDGIGASFYFTLPLKPRQENESLIKNSNV